ncbi:MAG: hypothetical protein ACTH5B_21220 [Marinomonas sp.]|uniref:hypothetical protein n=1 Tax=Marinomonas sp. TaxID=1904862 RepID=UPI003F9519E3
MIKLNIRQDSLEDTKRKRRKRSRMSINEAHQAMADFAKRIDRIVETTAPGVFTRGNKAELEQHLINVQMLCEGGFGCTEDFLAAIRIFKGVDLPRKD